MKQKTFKTLDEQVEILKGKGLTIADEGLAKYILLRENYFFFSGYRHLFLKSEQDKTFIPGTTFREVYGLFLFDRQLRNIVFKNILVVENNLKSIMAYVISKNHGYKYTDYLNPGIYNRDARRKRQVNDLLKKMSRQIRINGVKHTATEHYLNNYDFVPLWIGVKVLSFGIISELYTILLRDDQKEIADILNINVDDLLDYLPILANYRNLCAHEDLCYDHRTQKAIDDTKYHEALNIPKMNGEYTYGKNDLFSLIIILKQLLSDTDFDLLVSELSYELDFLSGRIKTIKVDKVLDIMGFPNNYKEISRL